jgi:hypothetical protein
MGIAATQVKHENRTKTAVRFGDGFITYALNVRLLTLIRADLPADLGAGSS